MQLVASMRAVHNVTETLALPAPLIDTAITPARAELARMLVQGRLLAVLAVTALLATIVSAALAQTALLLLVLSPFLARATAIETLAVGIMLSIGAALGAAIGALLTWKKVRRSVSVRAREVSSPAAGRALIVPWNATRAALRHR